MRSSLIVFFMSCCITQALAQSTSIGASVEFSFPQGEYQSEFPKTGVGARINIMRQLKEDGPISLGGEIGYLVTGSRTRYFDAFYGGGFYNSYKISASNNIFSLGFKARADLVPKERRVQFFVEANVGTNLFFSSVTVESPDYYGGSQYSGGQNSKGYWAFNWGPGIGVEIPLDKQRRTGLVVKGTYLLGGNTTYLTDPAIDNNGDVYFSQHESKTSMVIAELGIHFTLPKRDHSHRRGRR